jgi:hypothetical protein
MIPRSLIKEYFQLPAASIGYDSYSFATSRGPYVRTKQLVRSDYSSVIFLVQFLLPGSLSLSLSVSRTIEFL